MPLNLPGFLLGRKLAEDEGLEREKATRTALLMGFANVPPVTSAVVTQQSARREVASEARAAEVEAVKETAEAAQAKAAEVEAIKEAVTDLESRVTQIESSSHFQEVPDIDIFREDSEKEPTFGTARDGLEHAPYYFTVQATDEDGAVLDSVQDTDTVNGISPPPRSLVSMGITVKLVVKTPQPPPTP